MMNVKLSLYPETKQTAIGFIVSNILGAPRLLCKTSLYPSPQSWLFLADGSLAGKFEAVLSDLYQSKPPSRVEAFRILKPLVPADTAPELAPTSKICDLPPLQGSIAEEDMYDDFMTNMAGSAAVNIRLSAPQITALKQRVKATLISRAEPGFRSAESVEATIHLSSQDVIVALIISTINRFDDGHISQVSTTVTVSVVSPRVIPALPRLHH